MIFNIGGGVVSKLPVLNANYPQDVNITFISGNNGSATFSVVIAEDGKPSEYTYQWYVNGSPVSGATSASYTKSDITDTEIYNIYCEVTNKAGTVISRTATLNAVKYYTPVLNTNYPQDSSVTFIDGDSTNATFSVSIATAGNPDSYTYQWYVDDTAISGATSATYTRTGISTAGTYKVYCKVTNTAGTVTSRAATLTVARYYKPVLNTNYPENSSVTYIDGSSTSATFKVEITTAGNPASYTYQWYVNDSAVPGATSATYTRSGISTVGTYFVYCRVTNAAGTVQSRTATLTVTRYYKPILNTNYPANVSTTYISGNKASATFKVEISTAGNPASYTY